MRRDYTRWHLHGEGNSDEDEEGSDDDEDNSSDDELNIDDIHNMIRDAYPHMRDVEETSGSESLQRLFMSSKTAPDMRWHHENRSNDEVLRHPTDAKAWKSFDQTHESFSLDPRNKAQFDGKRDRKGAPKRLFGDDVLNQLGTLPPVTLDKAIKRKRLPGQTIFNRPERNDDRCPTTCDDTSRLPIFSRRGRPFGKSVVRELNNTDYYAASLYVLQNCDEIEPLVQEHRNILVDLGVNVDEMHRHEFICSFKERITKLYNDGNEQVDEHVRSLAWGLDKRATHYPCYNVNGFRFRTKQHNDAQEGIGYKLDRHRITSINRTRKLNTQEPFVLASQAIQVYYINCIKDLAWSVVIETKPRNLYDMPVNEEEPYQEEETNAGRGNQNVDENTEDDFEEDYDSNGSQMENTDSDDD
ncbi:hypothetical protein SO802_007031 [Lithocarpus litseifolius]|uniref:DUF4216 domain-containing protein n=1 Tax=Lithocarpus litseifolius TaxID=425828 RepID=A0AAW2DQQ9_9ROSI